MYKLDNRCSLLILQYQGLSIQIQFDEMLFSNGDGKQFYMLDKYQHFKKVSRTEGCSFYDAEDRTTMQYVLLKRMQQRCTWDELLTNRSLQFINKAKFAPKMVEIFKKKGYYFIVYEKPTGPPLSQPQLVGKLSLHKFFPLFYDLIQACMDIKEHNPQAYVLPQWIFINRNSCKIGHFEPFFPSEGSDHNKHVFMYNLEKSMQTSNHNLADSDILSFQRKQSLIFNLGAIAYQLLTGKKATNAENQEQYVAQLRELQQTAQKKLQRITEDDKFSQMIAKMIKQDPFDCPTLIQIYNTVKRKNKLYEPKDHSNPIVEVDLEKIQLTDKYNNHNSTKKKKFFRPCCKTVENQEIDVQFQKRGHLTMAYVKRQQHTRNRSFLPEIVTPKHQRYHSKDTFTSKPTMLRSEGDLRMKM